MYESFNGPVFSVEGATSFYNNTKATGDWLDPIRIPINQWKYILPKEK